MDITTMELYEADLQTEPLAIHMLPCRIAYEGPAEVSKYFIVDKLMERDAKADPSILVAAFRGRRLLGRKVELPKGCQGFVVKENFEFFDEDENSVGDEPAGKRILQVAGRFTEVHHWQQDTIPAVDAPLSKWLKVIGLARALHGHGEYDL